MAIFVDELRENLDLDLCNSKFIAHIFTDGDLLELHSFVKKYCGLTNKQWFDNRPDRLHYDINLDEYYNALKNGAILFNKKCKFCKFFSVFCSEDPHEKDDEGGCYIEVPKTLVNENYLCNSFIFRGRKKT
jgi:hypothetical protein